MGYRFKNYCVDTVTELHDLIAADCPTVTADGSSSIKCIPTSTDISIVIDSIPTTGTPISQSYIPVQIACDTAPKIADIVDYAWAVALIWLTAWGIREVYKLIKGR